MKEQGFLSQLFTELFGGMVPIGHAQSGPPGSGRHGQFPAMRPWRGTSRHVCGLWPFVAGGVTPLVGVPMGRALGGWGAVCADPISWFEKGLIQAPSMMVLGLNGLGKSSAVRHMLMGLAGFGVHSMVLGDIKPDYVDLVFALGGQVIDVGHGAAKINPLDSGNAVAAAKRLTGESRRRVLEGAHSRALTLVGTLIHIIRGGPLTDRESTIIDRCIRILESKGGTPELSDVLHVLREAPEDVRHAALDRGDIKRYQDVTEDLEASLIALLGGRFGAIFSGQTTTEMMLDRSVVFDVHSLLQAEEDLQAAVLLACWSYGFASIEVAQELADAGLQSRERYIIVMDELWRILRASTGLVERVDALTRLNRTMGVGQVMITHSMADFTALSSEADRLKAQGFVERSKMLLLGGLPRREMPLLSQVVSMSEAEQALLESWNDPGSYDPTTGLETAPPGRGRFLLKAGSGPGAAFEVVLTNEEIALSDTNKRWVA